MWQWWCADVILYETPEGEVMWWQVWWSSC